MICALFDTKKKISRLYVCEKRVWEAEAYMVKQGGEPLAKSVFSLEGLRAIGLLACRTCNNSDRKIVAATFSLLLF